MKWLTEAEAWRAIAAQGCEHLYEDGLCAEVGELQARAEIDPRTADVMLARVALYVGSSTRMAYQDEGDLCDVNNDCETCDMLREQYQEGRVLAAYMFAAMADDEARTLHTESHNGR